MEIAEYTLPASWAPWLINGDESGMPPLDRDDMRAWIAQHPGHWCAWCGNDEFFTTYHDARQYIGGAMCMDFAFHVEEV